MPHATVPDEVIDRRGQEWYDTRIRRVETMVQFGTFAHIIYDIRPVLRSGQLP